MQLSRPRTLALGIIAASLGLTGCNTNDEDGIVSLPGATRTITIVPSLGKISNARVVLRNAANRSQKLGDKPLSGDGSVSFTIPTNVPTVIAELVPTNATRYFDEAVPDLPATPANESLQPFPLTQKLRVAFAASGASQRIGMTAFTEAALVRAEALAGAQALNAALIAQANAYIQSVFGISNILQAPLVIGSQEDYLKLLSASNAAARDYAMRLAALAQQARAGLPADTPSPAVVMMQALSADLADGKLDRAGAGLPAQLPYADISGFANAWIAAMTALVNQIIAAIGTGEGGLSADQVKELNRLFSQLSSNININPNPVAGDATPVRVVAGIAEYSCADRDRVKSLTSNSRLDIDFVNQSGKIVNIDWLNNFGVAVRYRTALASGSTYAQPSTYVTHPWLITDTAGQCQGIYVATTTTKKTITLNSNGVATLAEAGGDGPGEDPEQPSCGAQQELTVQNLAVYAGTYNVAIKQNDPVTFETVTVKNTTLVVEANGKMTLDGQVANGVKYCANPNTVTNVTGLMVHLDKSDALGRSHVDFWPDNTVNGTDYTHAAGFRYFSGSKQGAGGGDSSVVSVNSTLCINPPFQTQTAFGITANAYNGCPQGSVSDFTLTASDTNPFGTHTDKGTPCQITKAGSLVTLTKGANSLTANLDGDAIDVVHVKSGNLADTDEQYEVIAKNNGGKRAIDVEIAKNGTVLSAHAMDVDAGIDLICLK